MTTANGTPAASSALALSKGEVNAKPLFDGVVFFLDSELAPETVSTVS